MAQYRYLAHDLRTNALLEELPLTGVSFGGVLNGAGAFTATLQLNQQMQTAPGVLTSKAALLVAATRTGRTIVYVERDGVLIDGYILWTRLYDSSSQTMQLAGQSVLSYFDRRRNNVDQTFLADDQLNIARTLISVAEAQPGGNIGVLIGSETCGVTRARTYKGYEHKKIGEAVRQLAAVDNGFDMSIDVAYVAGVPTKTLRLSYPSRGRGITDSGHVFEVGRNILSYRFPEDSATQVTRMFGEGAGDGAYMLVSTATRTDVIDAGWPLLEDAVAIKDVSVQSTLDAHTRAHALARGYPVAVPQVVVTGGGDPPIGGWILGDWAKFVFGTDPQRPDPMFPTRTELINRIVGYTCKPGDLGEDQVTLVLNGVT